MPKYLDFHGSVGELIKEMLVTGLGAAVVFGLWWLVYRLSVWLGWNAFASGFHLVGFIVAFLISLGFTSGAKMSAASASYGALFLDAAVMAVVCYFVHGTLWTLWTLVALVGVAIHFVGMIPAVAAARGEHDRKEDEKDLEKLAESLVAKGADPAEVRKAVEEILAEPGEGAAWSRLMMKFQKEIATAAEKERLEEERKVKALRKMLAEAEEKARLEEERKEAERAAHAKAMRKALAEAEEEERRRREEEDAEGPEEGLEDSDIDEFGSDDESEPDIDEFGSDDESEPDIDEFGSDDESEPAIDESGGETGEDEEQVEWTEGMRRTLSVFAGIRSRN